jgi:DNA (cytosine-5)-methyltransferase 1
LTLRAAELFAGVGGFRLGLEKSGIEVVWSNQWEPGHSKQWASKIYESHFGKSGHVNRDIESVLDGLETDSGLIEQFDVLVGGFPCQDYSVAKSLSSSLGLEGKKGVLWWQIHRLISIRKPKYVLLENVDRLISSPSVQRGRDFAIMVSSLTTLGYHISWRVINAADFGHPQKRKRTFIFAQLKSTDVNIFDNEFPSKAPEEVQKFALSSDLVALSEAFNLGGKVSPFLTAGSANSSEVTTWKWQPLITQATPLSRILESPETVPSEFWIPTGQEEKWQFLKGGKKLSRLAKDGFAYSYTEGRMAFPDSLEKPARTIVTGEGGLTPSRFKHVIRQNGRLRRLTPLELERANEFPDNWTRLIDGAIEVPAGRRAFLMGNALVVGVVEKLARQLRNDHEAQSNR